MSHSALRPWESVLVRHQLVAKHGTLEHIQSTLGASFKSTSSMSSSGHTALALSYALGRWMAAAQIGTSSWTSLNSNVGTAEELFKANCQGRRTEVVWAGKEPEGDGEVVLCWVVARKSQLTLRGHANDSPQLWQKKLQCTSTALKEKLLECSSIAKAFDVACKHLSLKIPAPCIVERDKKFICIGASGSPVTKGLKDFHIMSASGLDAKDSPAAVSLAKAIEAGDVAKIQRAITAGAPLDALPESSLTPLVAALFSYGKTSNWRECCQALIDAGCSVDGDIFTRPLHDAFESYIPEEMSVAIAELLLSNGANINLCDRNGLTVLDKTACSQQVQAVEFLLSRGADPHVLTRDDKSIVDEIRERFERDLEYSDTSRYHRVLELLTGSTIQQVTLPPAAEKEAERFLAIARSELLLKVIPEAADLKPMKASRLAKYDNFTKWTEELKRLGFEEAAHCTVTLLGKTIYTAYVHPKLGFDAVLSDDGPLGDGTLRLEVAAYHSAQNISMVTNKLTKEDPDLKLSLFNRKVIVGATPTQLIKELKRLVKTHPLQPISVASFLERFAKTLTAMLADYRNAAKQLGNNPIRLPSGELPRFERMGVYIKVKSQEAGKDYSSFAYVNVVKKSLARSKSQRQAAGSNRDCCDLREVVRDVALLAAVNHLQMAAAEDDTSYYPLAIDAAISLYETAAAAKQAVTESWGVHTLAFGLGLALLMQNWEAARQISAGIGADFAHPKHRRYSHHEPVALAQWQVLLTNRFRDRNCPKSKQFREEILAGRSKQAKSLLAALDALDAKDSQAFSQAILQSIKAVDALRRDSDRQFDVYHSIAWNESVLWMIAQREGLTAHLPSEQLDFLLA